VRPFLHVSDVVRAILLAVNRDTPGCHVFNLAPADTTTVATVAEQCVAASPYPETPIEYGTDEVGWRGDVRAVALSPWLAHNELRWSVNMTSDAASALAAREIARDVFGERVS
jgi:UDP-glucose 4-epimerase